MAIGRTIIRNEKERKRPEYSNADATFNKFMQNEIKWMRYLDERTMLCMKVHHQHPNILRVNKLAATSRWCYRTTKSKNIKAICILRFFSYLFSRNFSPSWRPRPIFFLSFPEILIKIKCMQIWCPIRARTFICSCLHSRLRRLICAADYWLAIFAIYFCPIPVRSRFSIAVIARRLHSFTYSK